MQQNDSTTRRIDITPKPSITIENTYVLGDTEVKKTGRKAQKTLPSGKLDLQFEVTPIHLTSGSWKKWVRDSELFEVVDE